MKHGSDASASLKARLKSCFQKTLNFGYLQNIFYSRKWYWAQAWLTSTAGVSR